MLVTFDTIASKSDVNDIKMEIELVKARLDVMDRVLWGIFVGMIALVFKAFLI